ncbi:hypothetical protein FZC66_12410 [Priestia megaterium]|nr:hypothetical protein FZC66_12410 [Priestia megaterium]
MKKWIIGIVVLVCLVIGWQTHAIYKAAVNDVQSAEQKAADRAKADFKLKSVTDTQAYFGDHTFYIVEGKNAKAENVIAWVPKSKKQKSILKKASSGISKEQAISIVEQERNPKEIKSVRLGIENNIPLWEVTYVDQEKKHLTYYYVDFTNGEFMKRYSLKQS